MSGSGEEGRETIRPEFNRSIMMDSGGQDVVMFNNGPKVTKNVTRPRPRLNGMRGEVWSDRIRCHESEGF